MNRPSVSIVIPAYNEEARLPSSLEKICAYFSAKNIEFEVIVVDDGSKDNTVETVRNFKEDKKFNIRIIKNEVNRGKGFSVKRGVLEAEGELILFSDADLSTPIEEAGKLIQALEEGYDIAIGSRAIDRSLIQIHQPRYRELMGIFFNFLVQCFVVWGIKDTQCGFKCFKRQVARYIFTKQKLDGFAFDVEILYIAKKNGYKIKEIPVRWYNDFDSKVSIVKDSMKMLLDLFKIKFNSLLGNY